MRIAPLKKKQEYLLKHDGKIIPMIFAQSYFSKSQDVVPSTGLLDFSWTHCTVYVYREGYLFREREYIYVCIYPTDTKTNTGRDRDMIGLV